MEKSRMILYRGSLKSCNYRCSYCPFSKHPRSERELLKDREQWQRFWESLGTEAKAGNIGAVMVVPYGEALIHPWYWEGLGRLASLERMDCVGAQTNLSFLPDKALEIYENAGGRTKKLRLWATFHPEMTTAEEFAGKCGQLRRRGILLCAGTVGVPGNLEVIRELRRKLPAEIYLWVNKMDGLGRNYTGKEIEAFRKVDPYFERELEMVGARPRLCRDRLFVEGDGRLRRCNISGILEENWYEAGAAVFDGDLRCLRKQCSCYLAYGGRDDAVSRVMFGPYPLFRIPRRPRAVFLDIDGTLIPQGEKGMEKRTVTDIRALAEDGCRLFFATTLPRTEARRRCRQVWDLFSGGVFAAGAHVVLKEEQKEREHISFLEESCLWAAEREQRRGRYQIRVYRDRTRGGIYKITLIRSGKRAWERGEIEFLGGICQEMSERRIRCFGEGHCMQIVDGDAGKAEGVRRICGWLGISPGETAAAGDSPEDEEMIRLCSFSGAGAVGSQ